MSRLQAWPLPALLAWSAAWLLHRLMVAAGTAPALALLAACALGVTLAWRQATRWRRLMVAGGFPLSALLSGTFHGALVDAFPVPDTVLAAPGVPAWLWLVPIAVLALIYPMRTWGDAPLFPTPAQALAQLPAAVPLPDGARLLDAGCGLGHGLQALRRAYPQARLAGVEWSVPVSLLARLRCPWASVRRGDMWAGHWGTHDLVYLFQRPESMPRAWAKARAEMRPGTWLVSLEFPVLDQRAHAELSNPAGKTVWVYRLPG